MSKNISRLEIVLTILIVILIVEIFVLSNSNKETFPPGVSGPVTNPEGPQKK